MIKRVTDVLRSIPLSLRRYTAGTGFIPEIDGLRFLAILPVVLQHYSERMLNAFPLTPGDSETTSWILSHGHIGVYLFFAISGFILALPFGKQYLADGKEVVLSQYFLRRLTRIEPPYLVAMTVLFFVLIIVKHEPFQSLFPHYIASLFYVHRIVYDSWSPINPPAWTLEVEVQYYLIAPFVMALYFKIRHRYVRRTLLLLFVVIKVVVANTTTLFDNLYLTLPFMIEYFFIGILVADLYLSESITSRKSNHFINDLLGIVSVVLLFCSWTWGKNISWKFVFLASLFFTFFFCFRGNLFRQFFRLPWITAIGGMCYSIYLLHLAFAEFFVIVISRLSPFGNYLMNLIFWIPAFLFALFVVSAIFFKLIEQPCMDPGWYRKLSHIIRSRVFR